MNPISMGIQAILVVVFGKAPLLGKNQTKKQPTGPPGLPGVDHAANNSTTRQERYYQ